MWDGMTDLTASTTMFSILSWMKSRRITSEMVLVGTGFGEVGSMGNYSALPDALKLNSMILMMLGRLEIYPFFLVFGRFWD